LYEQSRFDSLNNGQPISGYTVQKLSLKKLFQNRDYVAFDAQLDGAPHGAMHNYIGAGNPRIILSIILFTRIIGIPVQMIPMIHSTD
jgi:hypothetical protein